MPTPEIGHCLLDELSWRYSGVDDLPGFLQNTVDGINHNHASFSGVLVEMAMPSLVPFRCLP